MGGAVDGEAHGDEDHAVGRASGRHAWRDVDPHPLGLDLGRGRAGAEE